MARETDILQAINVQTQGLSELEHIQEGYKVELGTYLSNIYVSKNCKIGFDKFNGF